MKRSSDGRTYRGAVLTGPTLRTARRTNALSAAFRSMCRRSVGGRLSRIYRRRTRRTESHRVLRCRINPYLDQGGGRADNLNRRYGAQVGRELNAPMATWARRERILRCAADYCGRMFSRRRYKCSAYRLLLGRNHLVRVYSWPAPEPGGRACHPATGRTSTPPPSRRMGLRRAIAKAASKSGASIT